MFRIFFVVFWDRPLLLPHPFFPDTYSLTLPTRCSRSLSPHFQPRAVTKAFPRPHFFHLVYVGFCLENQVGAGEMTVGAGVYVFSAV